MANDFAKLQGAWTLRSLVLEGQEMPPAGGIEIDGDRFIVNGMGAEYSGTIELDPKAKPKRFDMLFTHGPETGNRNRGIYELTGDTWKICLNMEGKSRPRSFTAKPGSGNALEVFARGAGAVADETASLPDDSGVASDPEILGEWTMLAASQSGYALEESMVRTGRRVTTATHTTTYFGKQVFRSADYVADPSQTPKTIDMTSKGKVQFGIYDVTGDVMRICFGAPGAPRPTDFETRGGDGCTSAVWKRAALL